MKEVWQWTMDWWKKVPGPLLIILAIGVFCVLIIYLYCISIEENFLQAIDRNGTRTLILLLAGIIGWYFLYQRTTTAKQSTRIAEQGLTVDRLNRAIEQLASEKPYVRVGGIHGLEKIADTHEEESKSIARILVSFIRTRATKDSEETGLKEKKEEFDAHREQRLDIEIAVKTLARIASKLKKQKQIERYDDDKYHLCNLENLDLRGLRLEDVNLSEFGLEGADFSGAWLRGVNFTGAHLFRPFGIKVLRAIFFKAHLDNVDFTRAYLNHVIFTEAYLTATKFDNVILQNAIFDGAVVNGTHFECSQCLTQEQIDKTYYCGEPPHLPDGLELPPKESYYRMEHIP